MSERSVVQRLVEVISARKAMPPGSRSYVRSLIEGGDQVICGKIIEEAAEVAEAAGEPGEPGRAHLVREISDLLFHTLVLLGEKEISWGDIEAELARRFGVSGLDEKAARQAIE
jgi:phosphoribosyl-ATP pyrophosphohydrolase